MSYSEIAARSGLNRSTVVAISSKTSWRGLTLDTIIRFTNGCGVNLLRLDRHLDYLRRRKKVAFTPMHRRILAAVAAAAKRGFGGAQESGSKAQRT
jgi:hypothetical protein